MTRVRLSIILILVLLYPAVVVFAGRGAAVQGYNFVTHFQNAMFGKPTGYNYSPTARLDDDGVYKMWWTSNAPTDGCDGSHDTIWYATSSDGIYWQNFQVAVTAGPYHLLVADPEVVKIDGIYYMYYTGTSDLRNNGVNNSIFVSTSSDGVSWTPNLQAAVPLPNPDPTGQQFGIGSPTVVYRTDLNPIKIQMWFTWIGAPSGSGLYYTESTDPLNFPVASAARVFNAGGPDIKYIPALGIYVMAFEYRAPDGSRYTLFNVSHDGISWLGDPFDDTARAEMNVAAPNSGLPGMLSDPGGRITGDSFLYSHGNANDNPGCTWQIQVSSLNVYQIPADALYRFSTEQFHDRYYATSPTNPDFYTYEGMAAILLAPGTGGVGDLYQLYNKNTVKHLYTSSWDEVLSAVGVGFEFENAIGPQIGLSQLSGTVPFYRLRQQQTNEYLYTVDGNERYAAKVYYGYVDENSPGFVLPPQFQTGKPYGLHISSTGQSFAAQGGSGSVRVTALPDFPWTVVNNDPSFITVTSSNSFTGSGEVNYMVSAQPGSSTARSGTLTIAGLTFTIVQGADFNDVLVTHPFYDYIGKLSARGVTAGCGGGSYCPDSLVTREQMAVFIIKALGDFSPSNPLQQRFQDVEPGRFSYPFIDDMAVRQITGGCSVSPPLYCPDSTVTREQMGVFIIKALGDFSPWVPLQQRFQDVDPTRFSYPFIDEMASRLITGGCSVSPALYCPDLAVTRGQMAVFLVRAFGL